VDEALRGHRAELGHRIPSTVRQPASSHDEHGVQQELPVQRRAEDQHGATIEFQENTALVTVRVEERSIKYPRVRVVQTSERAARLERGTLDEEIAA
jgi:hypothetical protein